MIPSLMQLSVFLQGGAPREATLEQVAQYKADIKASRIKGGSRRRDVMFIHQSLPGDGSSNQTATKRRGRPKKNRVLPGYPQQTVVTTTVPVVSSVIKETASCSNNDIDDIEDGPLSPTPLQIDLAPRSSPEHEEQMQQLQQQPLVMQTTTVTVPANEVATVAPPLPIVTKKRKPKKAENMEKMSFGEQARSIEAGNTLRNYHLVSKIVIGLKVTRKRGRKSKALSILTQRSTVLKDSLSADVAASMATGNAAVGGTEQSVICDTPTQHSNVEKKHRRNMLLMKAQADRAKKRAEVSEIQDGQLNRCQHIIKFLVLSIQCCK